jgi:hypothetical protein
MFLNLFKKSMFVLFWTIFEGAGYVFGQDVTEQFIHLNGLKFIVRAHQLVASSLSRVDFQLLYLLPPPQTHTPNTHTRPTSGHGRTLLASQQTTGNSVQCPKLLLQVGEMSSHGPSIFSADFLF